jgi:hypothetical protein
VLLLTIELVKKSVFPPFVGYQRKWVQSREAYLCEVEDGHRKVGFDGIGELYLNQHRGTLTVVIVPAEKTVEVHPVTDARRGANGRTFEFGNPFGKTLLRLVNQSAGRELEIRAEAGPHEVDGVGARISPQVPSLKASAEATLERSWVPEEIPRST